MVRKTGRRQAVKHANDAEVEPARPGSDGQSESGLDDVTEAGEAGEAGATYEDAVNLPAHQTKHLSELVYRFPRLDTAFRLVQRNDTNSTGSSLWLSSQVLSSFLLHMYAKLPSSSDKHVPRKRVLELGSGTGMLSLLMARLGWQVVATDIEPVLESVLRPNIEAGLYQLIHQGHATADQAQVVELDWTDAEHQRTSLPDVASGEINFDLVLTADTVYEPSLVRPLFSTLHGLYRARAHFRPTVLLALERRDPAHIDHALQLARDEFDLPFKQIPAKRIRKIFDTLGDGSTWPRDDWTGVEIWKL